MNLLDAALLVLIGLAGWGGWRLGLITRALSWAGMALGVIGAARILPAVITSARSQSNRAELLLIVVGLLVGGAFLGQALGLLAGSRLHLAVKTPTARRVDSVGGGLAGALGVIVAIWLVIPAVADVPGWPARMVRHSRVVQTVADLLPAAPDATATLRRLLGQSYPQVFDALRPTPAVGTPPSTVDISPALSRRITRSTVKVLGRACGDLLEGSGFVIGRGLVVTNAHVVAGATDTLLERSDGSRVQATVVAFDPMRDVAVLSAPGIGRPALRFEDAATGTKGAVYGHPGGGPLVIAPFRIGQRITALGTDIYQHAHTRRDVLVIASDLARGDSGSALVTSRGVVVGMAFAISPDRAGVAYALAVDEIQPVLAKAGGTPVSAGKCLVG